MIIVRTLFDIENEMLRTYQRDELSVHEQFLLDTVGSFGVQIERMIHEHQTSIIYSIL